MVAEPLPLIAILDLLDADRGRADPSARHDQRVIRQFIDVHQAGRAKILGGLKGLQQGQVGVTAATRTQYRAAAS